jgi:hypothetical protein
MINYDRVSLIQGTVFPRDSEHDNLLASSPIDQDKIRQNGCTGCNIM